MKTSVALSDLVAHISSDQETSNINLDGQSKLWGRCSKGPGRIAVSWLLRNLCRGGSAGALCFSLGLGRSSLLHPNVYRGHDDPILISDVSYHSCPPPVTCWDRCAGAGLPLAQPWYRLSAQALCVCAWIL